MQSWTLQVPLIVCGGALVAMGVLRLAAGWFATMPSAIAVAIAVGGAGVVVFGGSLTRWQPVMEPPPRVELERRAPDATAEPAPLAEVTGVVRRVGGEAVAGTKVVLVSPHEGDLLVRSETRSGPDGRFSFSGVEIGGPYILTTSFDGVGFESRSFLVPSEPVEVLVAHTTTEHRVLRVRAASLALVGDEEGLQAVQAITIVNRDDRAFVGELRLPLLPGATALQPTTGLERSRLSLTAGALVSRAPVLPGETQIAYTYVAPTSRTGLEFSNRIDYPTERLDLLVGGRLHTVSAEPPARPERVTLGDRPYERVSWRSLEPGDAVRARIGERAPSSAWPVAGIAAAAAAAAAIVILPLVRRRRHGRAIAEPGGP